MRTLAIGDIHGCLHALQTLQRTVPFRPDDTLILLGDYVDRGLNSAGVLDWILWTRDRQKVIALRGNHDQMMLAALQDEIHLQSWLNCGGDAALASYSHFGDEGQLIDVPPAHRELLETGLVRYHEAPTHLFVHGAVLPDLPLEDQPDFVLYWERFNEHPPHHSGKTIVCGHTSQKDGMPKDIGHAICIDTWACGEGWLTCLDVETNRYWQARESGETRSGMLIPMRHNADR